MTNELLALMNEKLHVLQRALILETDAAVKFKLKKQIKELEQEIVEAYQGDIKKLINELQETFPKEATNIAKSGSQGSKSDGVPLLRYLKELEKTYGEQFRTDAVKKIVSRLCQHYGLASFESVTPEEVKEKADVLRVQIKARDSKVFLVDTLLCKQDKILQFSFIDGMSFKTLTPNKEKQSFIQTLRNALNKDDINYDSILVEFAVEKVDDLDCSFHKWADTKGIMLSNKYRVTVRLATRNLKADCRCSWKKAEKKCQTCSGGLFVWLDELNPNSNTNNHSGIGFKRKPTRKELGLFDSHGVAIAIWSSQATEDYQNMFSDLLKNQSFTTVPQVIRDFRANHVNDDITLFWDEPERINLNPEKEYFHGL